VTASARLPHAYPFRFVETVITPEDRARGTVLARVTSGGRATAGEGWGSPLLLAEAIAQAALALQGGDPETQRRGYLAGIDGLEISRIPRVGDALQIDVRLSARFGAIVRFEGVVRCGEERIASGAVLVREGFPEGRS
jgi:3-hydroxymyristoyl/3-hydroxydecanoyl-(acyl carrier protein) dehydratase